MKKLILVLLLLASPLRAGILQEDTAKNVVVWLYDSTTQAPKTGVAAAGVTCQLIKDNGTTGTSITAGAGGRTWTEIGGGAYALLLLSTDTSTAGVLELGCTATAAVSPPTNYDIYPTNAYAASIGGAVASIDDEFETDCSTVTNTNSPAGRICGSKFVRYEAVGTADSGNTVTLVDTERTEANNYWTDKAFVVFTSGVVAGQGGRITAFNSTTDTITFTPALTTGLSGGETYEIRAFPFTNTAGATDVNVISWAGTTVATPDTAGYPKVTIKDGTGQGELSITAGQLDGLSTPAQVATAVWSNIPANAFTAAKFDPDVSAEFAATLMGTAVEVSGPTTETFKDFLRYGAAMLFRNYTSSSGSFSFKGLDPNKSRVNYSTTQTSRTVTSKDATD